MTGNAPSIPGYRDLALVGERVARSLFSATSERDGRPVTVTVFPPLGEGRTREAFGRAATTAQRLGAHPSVVTIHGWGHADDGRPWIVTEPQPAESVDTLLTLEGPLEVARAVQVGVLLAGALETAHRARIVHGDLSPARLVFGAHGEPLLVDMGLAPFAVFPGLGALNNPVRYHAPPEVLERTGITPATDVYSLATTVYALLAGRAPQQKPAEITDSNASLLLRILQMPVPAIGRPDLPPGLEDVLRAAMAPTPERRPQQAIEVAWMLQDVQRRAGLPVTEPVVLDLDVIDAGPDDMTAPAGPARSGLRAPAPARPDWPEAAAAAGAAATGAGDAADTPARPPAAASSPAAAAGPVTEPETPAPTIFPFAEGHDDPATAPTAPPAEPGGTLWPSTWPAATAAADELPTWATADLAGDGGAEAPPGPDGGPQPATDRPPSPGGEGEDGSLFLPAAADRPPELDQLPSWYTDPLPSDQAQANGRVNGHGAPLVEPPGGGGERLPGAGDDLRSLFGEVVADPPADRWPPAGVTRGAGSPDVAWPHTGTATPPDRPRTGPAGDDWPHTGTRPGTADERWPDHGTRPGVAGDGWPRAGTGSATGPGQTWSPGAPAGLPAGPEVDPLGPPSDRPPIDLSQLDKPLGPAPFLPADSGGTARLPRRHETSSWPPAGREGGAGRLPPETVTEGDGSARPRSAPRQVAPSPDRARADAPAGARAGPPALPVIVLLGVLVVLIIGVAWVVITGDGAGQPASRTSESTATDAAATGTGAAVPGDLLATPVAEGVQLTWKGDAGASYVVTVLSPQAPPQPRPAAVGTSAMIPAAELGGAPGNCFTVATADASGVAGQPSSPACTPGASVEAMQAG